MQITPLASGHTGFSSTGLELIRASEELIEEVTSFRTTVRDFSAPRMSRASSIEAPTIMEQARDVRSKLLNATA